MAGGKRKHQPEPQRRQPKLKHTRGLVPEDDTSVVSSRNRSRTLKRLQEEQELLDPKISSKILHLAERQNKEIQKETEQETPQEDIMPAVDDDAEDLSSDDLSEIQAQFDVTQAELDPEEEMILEVFMNKNPGPQLTLADIIAEKIKKKGEEADTRPKFEDSIIELYKGVGKLLSRYTTGKIPKAFRRIPSLHLWEEVLQLTDPPNWSPCAMYQATRIFASTAGVKKTERFYKLVLLPRMRDDIRKNKRLHDRLYQSLKKALYKPAAFFKGILLPLCQSGTCSLREAVIVGSIIEKISIPVLHSSVALMRLAGMEYCGTTSYFLKLFLDKKYALPYRVLDAVVAHFMRFLDDERIMPVIWHQSLLSFVQRYKNELTKEDRDNLDRLMQHQKHYLVTPEIRREMHGSSHVRGEKETEFMSICSPVSIVNRAIEEDRWDFPDVPMEED